MPTKPFSMESREKIARIDNHRNVFRDAPSITHRRALLTLA